MSAPVAVPFRLARRLDEVGFSDIVQIRNRVMELRAKGAAVYQFEGGEPYRTTPDYIKMLFTERLGNLMLVGCVIWMGCGIGVMKKMISFKH